MKAYVMLTRAGLRAFFRDRAGLFWSFFFPIFFIVIFGSIFGNSDGKPPQFNIGLVAPDKSEAAKWVPDVFKKVPVFIVHEGPEDKEREALLKGERRVLVVFPANFSENVISHQPADIKLYYDPAQEQTARIVLGIVKDVIGRINQELSQQPAILTAKEERLSPKTAGPTRQQKSIDFLIPGILAMTLMQLGIFTAIPLIGMREKGILKRYRATPLPRPTLIASQISMRLVIAVVQTMILILIGKAMYGFQVAGSWPALIGLVIFGALTFICIGAVISSTAKTQESGMPIVQLVNMPMMFLSGLFFPIEILPKFMQSVSTVLPATYLADALRNVTTSAPLAHPLYVDLGAMALWMVICLAVASRIFKWE